MKRVISKVAVFVTVALAATGLHAQQTKTILSGVTKVVPASSFVSNLQSLGITLGAVTPSQKDSTGFSFPMTGGAVDLSTGSAQALHTGGLTLTAGATQVRLESLIIDTTGTEYFISGLVIVDNKLIGRVPLFDLQPPLGVLLPLIPNQAGVLTVNGLALTLTTVASGDLNTIFNTTLLQPHLEVGVANVVAVLGAATASEDDQNVEQDGDHHSGDQNGDQHGESGDHNGGLGGDHSGDHSGDQDGYSSHAIQLHHQHALQQAVNAWQ